MSSKEQTRSNEKGSTRQMFPKPDTEDLDVIAEQQTHPAIIVQRAELEPSSLTASHVLQLQRSIGNQALGRILADGGNLKAAGATDPASPVIQRLSIQETEHYGSSRDKSHSDAKAALLIADADQSISRKIFGKHRSKQHPGKCVSSFPASNKGYVVIVTYADLQRQVLKYDTAFLSAAPANPPEKTAISFNPDGPVITVGST